jgi:hypothetical protein
MGYPTAGNSCRTAIISPAVRNKTGEMHEHENNIDRVR